MSPAPALAFEGVTAAYGAARPLGPFDLAVGAGEIVALVGRSGCGKSTFLMAAAGVGAARIEGRLHRDAPGAPGVVFQEPTLMPWRTALENVALPFRLAGAEGEAAALAALADVGLAEAAGRKPGALSVGMRMRVALARAIAPAPGLLLLDEPFAAIDEIGRAELDRLVLRLRAERGFAALLVTHAVEEAVLVADRVAVMAPGGRIAGFVACAGDKTAGDALDQPALQAAAAEVRRLLRSAAP